MGQGSGRACSRLGAEAPLRKTSPALVSRGITDAKSMDTAKQIDTHVKCQRQCRPRTRGSDSPDVVWLSRGEAKITEQKKGGTSVKCLFLGSPLASQR